MTQTNSTEVGGGRRSPADPSYIAETRELALNNFFFFCRAILGFDKLTNRFHKDMCEHIQDWGSIRRLWLLPRDHFKSTIVSIAYPLWRLVRDPEERILIAADTATNAEKKLAKIKSLILESTGIRAFFPEIIPPNTNKTQWSDSAITIPRKGHHAEPSVSTIGAGGAVVGQHFTHIILDDIVAKEAADSLTVMDSVKRWVDNVESLLVEPYRNTIDVVGTRWAHNDVYEHINSHWPTGNETGETFYSKFELGFWDGPDDFDNVLFPELYGGVTNAKDYARRNEKQNSYLWSCNFLNDPTVPEAEFNVEDLQNYYYDKDEEHVIYEAYGRAPRVISLAHLHVYITCDPAYSLRAGASKAAIVVSGCYPSGEIFILEYRTGQWGGEGVKRELIDCARKYRHYLKVIGIEATGTQQTFVDSFRKEALRAGIYTTVDYLKPEGPKNKTVRIRFHLQPYVSTRRLYIRADMHELYDQMRKFPLDENRQDLLDATAYAAEHYWGRFHGFEETGESEKVAARESTRNASTGY